MFGMSAWVLCVSAFKPQNPRFQMPATKSCYMPNEIIFYLFSAAIFINLFFFSAFAIFQKKKPNTIHRPSEMKKKSTVIFVDLAHSRIHDGILLKPTPKREKLGGNI